MNRRFWRVGTTLCLALFQVNLLWVAALHRHELMGTSRPRPPAVRKASQPQPPAVDGGLLCTACQIVRHAAARPATAVRAPEAQSSAVFFAGFCASAFPSRQPTALYGRAPPLA